jgi:hypothetical protein
MAIDKLRSANYKYQPELINWRKIVNVFDENQYIETLIDRSYARRSLKVECEPIEPAWFFSFFLRRLKTLRNWNRREQKSRLRSAIKGPRECTHHHVKKIWWLDSDYLAGYLDESSLNLKSTSGANPLANKFGDSRSVTIGKICSPRQPYSRPNRKRCYFIGYRLSQNLIIMKVIRSKLSK